MNERALAPNQAAHALAACRIVVFALCGWDVMAAGDPARLAALPREWFVEHGVLRLLPDAFIEMALLAEFLAGARWVALALAGAVILGLRPHALLAVSFCSLHLLLRGLAAGFGSFIGHDWVAMTFCSWILAACPAADALALRRSRSPRRAELYVGPIVAMGAVLCTCYFLLGFRRIARNGLEIFLGDALPTYVALASLKNGAYEGFEYGVLVLASPLAAIAMKVGFFVVTLMEVLAPICVFSPWFRWPWLTVMIPFHFATLFTMNIFFDDNVVLMLLLLTPLPFWIGAKLAPGTGPLASGRPGAAEAGSPRRTAGSRR